MCGSVVYVLHDTKRVATKMAFFNGPEAVCALQKLHGTEPPASPRSAVLASGAVDVFLTRVARMPPRDVCVQIPRDALLTLRDWLCGHPKVVIHLPRRLSC